MSGARFEVNMWLTDHQLSQQHVMDYGSHQPMTPTIPQMHFDPVTGIQSVSVPQGVASTLGIHVDYFIDRNSFWCHILCVSQHIGFFQDETRPWVDSIVILS